MEKISANLHLFTRESKLGGGWMNYSWLLKRKGGNFLIACADVTENLAEIKKLGGVSRVFLTDIHFANKWHGEICKHFGASFVCHESDAAKVKTRCGVAKVEALGARTQLEKDFLAIHTPGHAEGGLCYFWNDGKENALFTGDFLAHTKDGWSVFCGKAKHKIMTKSLTTVGELPVTLLCPGVSNAEPVSHIPLKSGEFSRLTAETIKKCCT
jgi:glyoxylase-like metal-dependent hydrolase (beta-lactamase superfamily II)